MKWIAALVTALLCANALSSYADTRLALSDGDRVAFVGATLVERDLQFGWFETMLHARFPKAAFTFRNLGWSADTVWGDARAEFGTQEDGYKKLVDEVIAAKPTVLLLNYGNNESFAGQAGLSRFIEQYAKLLDDLSKTGAKVWLIGPNQLVKLPAPLPDPSEHNLDVKRYVAATRELAAKRGCGFVDLFNAVKEDPGEPISDDEIHFTLNGAKKFAEVMVTSLAGEKPKASTSVMEPVRLKTIDKNRQFFYRWRPQNDTYIFGFRKHEQGQNAVEIPKFDPIVEKLEQEIAETSKNSF